MPFFTAQARVSWPSPITMVQGETPLLEIQSSPTDFAVLTAIEINHQGAESSVALGMGLGFPEQKGVLRDTESMIIGGEQLPWLKIGTSWIAEPSIPPDYFRRMVISSVVEFEQFRLELGRGIKIFPNTSLALFATTSTGGSVTQRIPSFIITMDFEA